MPSFKFYLQSLPLEISFQPFDFLILFINLIPDYVCFFPLPFSPFAIFYSFRGTGIGTRLYFHTIWCMLDFNGQLRKRCKGYLPIWYYQRGKQYLQSMCSILSLRMSIISTAYCLTLLVCFPSFFACVLPSSSLFASPFLIICCFPSHIKHYANRLRGKQNYGSR